MEISLSEPEITTTVTENSNTDTDSVVVDYTAETGEGVFDHYVFSINDQDKTKNKDDTDIIRRVEFDKLEAGTLYIVTAFSKSGNEKSRDINTLVRTGETM